MERTRHRDEEARGEALEFAVPVGEDGLISLQARLPVRGEGEGPRLVRVVVVLEEPDAEEIVSEISKDVGTEDAGKEPPHRAGTPETPPDPRATSEAEQHDPALSSHAFLYQVLRNRLVHEGLPPEPSDPEAREYFFARSIVFANLYRLWEHASTLDATGAARLELSGPSDWTLKRPFDIVIRRPREGEDIPEAEWLRAASSSSAFDFLADSEEDIYTLEDGEPFRADEE